MWPQYAGPVTGEPDIAAVAEVLADQSRCRMLLALGDGRALPASMLAREAGVAASTASSHLARLTQARMVTVERHGRHKYFRLAGPHVGELIELLARSAPPLPVRSLRDSTRAAAIRRARTCYDHMAGQLGVDLMAALLADNILAGGDGMFDSRTARHDRLSARGSDIGYELTGHGIKRLEAFGVDCAPRGRRQFIRYCVDWSEQRHHVSGVLGARLLDRFEALNWVERHRGSRALTITDQGAAGLTTAFGLDVSGLRRAA